jgi:ATP-dependent DNA helicase RecG
LFSRIRNVQVRMVVKGTLHQIEVPKYSDKMVLEALHNCIAHQDYMRSGRVVVTEYVDRLALESRGSFYYGCPDDYIKGECTPPDYRNPQLVDAMSELNMIDTMGHGFHRMYAEQAKRYMPLHDYLLTPQSVTMTIYGHFLDESYSSLLVKHPEFQLEDVWLLDRVQKGLPISDTAATRLRKRGLVAGRKTKLKIIVGTGDLTRTHPVGVKLKPHHQKLIDFLANFPGASRGKINEVMMGEIAGGVSENKKLAKITNVLTYLRKKGLIENLGTDTDSHWNLCKRGD